MSIVLDLIGSMIVRGAIMLTFLYLVINLQDALYDEAMYAAVKQKTVIPAEILTDDLRLAGYGPTTSKTFQIADTQYIKFSADVDNDSTPDVVYYHLGTAYAGTNHMSLYRSVSSINGGADFELARDIVSLTFTYYNVLGDMIAYGNNVSGIKSIRVSLTIESNAQNTDLMTIGRGSKGLYYKASSSDTAGNAFTTHYVRALWERVIFPQNL
jgi:hypothetical protein